MPVLALPWISGTGVTSFLGNLVSKYAPAIVNTIGDVYSDTKTVGDTKQTVNDGIVQKKIDSLL